MKKTTVTCKELFCNLEIPVERKVLPGNLLLLSVENGIVDLLDDYMPNSLNEKLKPLDINPNPDNLVIISSIDNDISFSDLLESDNSQIILEQFNVNNKVGIYLTCEHGHTHKYFIEI